MTYHSWYQGMVSQECLDAIKVDHITVVVDDTAGLLNQSGLLLDSISCITTTAIGVLGSANLVDILKRHQTAWTRTTPLIPESGNEHPGELVSNDYS